MHLLFVLRFCVFRNAYQPVQPRRRWLISFPAARRQEKVYEALPGTRFKGRGGEVSIGVHIAEEVFFVIGPVCVATALLGTLAGHRLRLCDGRRRGV
jgi:hypothetical protein